MDEESFKDFIIEAEIALTENIIKEQKKILREKVVWFEARESQYIDEKCDVLAEKMRLIEALHNKLDLLTPELKERTRQTLEQVDKYIESINNRIDEIHNLLTKSREFV